MYGIDPLTAMPERWSLRPEDTLGMVFWTRDGRNLVRHQKLLEPYQKVVHFTLTGWQEVEHKAPNIEQGLSYLKDLVGVFGAENVFWRFSPIPAVSDVVERFKRIAEGVQEIGLKEVYVAFLQTNDLWEERRDGLNRSLILAQMAKAAPDLEILLCREDTTMLGQHPNLRPGICEPGTRFHPNPQTEGCGCALAVDPFTLNESCIFGCEYCLGPETPVLTSDHIWKPLKEIREGDFLLAFDESPPGLWKKRKYQKALVEGVYYLEKDCLKVTLENGTEVITSEDHLWLTGSSRKMWTPAKKLCLDHKLLSVTTGVTVPYNFDEDYYAGYLTGMTIGDGTFRISEDKQSYWRVALVDMEPLVRTQEALRCFGVSLEIKPFDSGSDLTTKTMNKLETRKKAHLGIIHNLMEKERFSTSYRRGFLAGAFDAEGSFHGSLRIYQIKGNDLLVRCQNYAAQLGISFDLEDNAVRSNGEHRNRLRFFAETRPALTRKRDRLIGKMADFEPVSILKIERLGPYPVIDIKTSTSTFMAAGLATHNCYAADKKLAPKKRNTTKSLPVIG